MFWQPTAKTGQTARVCRLICVFYDRINRFPHDAANRSLNFGTKEVNQIYEGDENCEKNSSLPWIETNCYAFGYLQYTFILIYTLNVMFFACFVFYL